jgi:ABC-type uncharacterized transport system substrate-binding protein
MKHFSGNTNLQVLCGILGVLLFCSEAVAATKVTLLVSRANGPFGEVAQSVERTDKTTIEKINVTRSSHTQDELVKKIMAQQSDVVVAVGGKAITFSRQLDTVLPVLYTMVYDPVDFVDRKVGGVIIRISIEEQIARLRQLFPERKCIGVIFTQQYSGQQVNQARNIVGKYGFQIAAISIEKAEEIPDAMKRLLQGTVDIVWMVADPLVAHPKALRVLVSNAQANKIPLIGLSKYHVNKGALAAFSVDFADVGEQVMSMAIQGFEANEVQSPRKVIIYISNKQKQMLKIDDLENLPENQYLD